ncbi:MAG: Lrp/AsnC family transcriptional regulator [Clostridia bacterium]|nr:Lrp/AsnC family transcriptional regulator [Clostridia bacterium]
MENSAKKIIDLLQENARYDAETISVMTGIDKAEVEKTIADLEDKGVIVKYSAIVNTDVINEDAVEALIEVKVVPQKLKGFDAFAEELYHFNEVKSLYLMSGGFDLAVFVLGKNISEIAKFVSEKLGVIDGIVGVQTHFVLKKYKIEGQICKRETIERQLVV